MQIEICHIVSSLLSHTRPFSRLHFPFQNNNNNRSHPPSLISLTLYHIACCLISKPVHTVSRWRETNRLRSPAIGLIQFKKKLETLATSSGKFFFFFFFFFFFCSSLRSSGWKNIWEWRKLV